MFDDSDEETGGSPSKSQIEAGKNRLDQEIAMEKKDSVLDQTKKKGDYGTMPTDDEKKKLELVLMLSHQREKQKFITRSIINGIR